MQNKSILFLVHRYPKGKNSILEKDFVKIFHEKGWKVKVIVPLERKYRENTNLFNDNGIEVLYVKTGNNFNKVSKIEKIMTLVTTPYLIIKAVKKYFNQDNFDYVVGYTPLMANPKLFNFFKRKYGSKNLLFLWDIFPQNAQDLGMIKSKIIFNFLKSKEKKMYEAFDKIICNCEGQIEYILKNRYKSSNDLMIARNPEYVNDSKLISIEEKIKLKENFGYDKESKIAIFGGNMGIPQQLENIIEMIDKLKDRKNLKFIFLGDGTEKEKIKKLKNKLKLENLKILDFVPREEYEKITKICDIGLISLNKQYTVPNFPAKVTGYIKQGVPIFASLDECSKKYLGRFIEDNRLGLVASAGNIDEMTKKFLELADNLENCTLENALEVYRKNFDVDKAYKIIEKEIIMEERNV